MKKLRIKTMPGSILVGSALVTAQNVNVSINELNGYQTMDLITHINQ